MVWAYPRSGHPNTTLTGFGSTNTTSNRIKVLGETLENQKRLTHLCPRTSAHPSARGCLRHQLMTKFIFSRTQEMVGEFIAAFVVQCY